MRMILLAISVVALLAGCGTAPNAPQIQSADDVACSTPTTKAEDAPYYPRWVREPADYDVDLGP